MFKYIVKPKIYGTGLLEMRLLGVSKAVSVTGTEANRRRS